MLIILNNNPFSHDAESLCRVFFPFEKIKVVQKTIESENIVLETKIEKNNANVSLKFFDKTQHGSAPITQNGDNALEMSALIYRILSGVLNYYPQWGVLTGVRPAKLMHRIVNDSSIEEAKKYFTDKLLVSNKKTELALSVMNRENRIIALSRNNSFSLYISIPFCPSRCSYCSFVSHSVEQAKKLIEPYVDLLVKEIEKTARISNELGLRLETVYFGGGTPTTLSAQQLNRIICAVQSNFDFSTVSEFTVEAGRPDTVTKEKLEALKALGVSRISINAQTFNDEILNNIGRRHTVKMTLDAFEIARKCGFDNINTDLIAGLPGESFESFRNSVDSAVELSCENVTVHTLSLKTASRLAKSADEFSFAQSEIVNQMVDYSNEKLKSCDYQPYYMYRQSKTAGNLENVGWCKNNLDCRYNVYMMDETHSVFAIGAGAVTKLRDPNSTHIERVYNFKYPYEYIDRFSEILDRKKSILDFYNNILV